MTGGKGNEARSGGLVKDTNQQCGWAKEKYRDE